MSNKKFTFQFNLVAYKINLLRVRPFGSMQTESVHLSQLSEDKDSNIGHEPVSGITINIDDDEFIK